MKNWRLHRQILILITFAGVFFTLVRFSLDATAGNRPVTSFAFPSVVPLPGWKLIEGNPLTEPIPNLPESWESILASRKYYYKKNNQQIEIEMRYVVGTLGDLNRYFKDYTSIELQDTQLLQNLRQQSGIGYYSLFVYQGRSHLSACINPRGGSTATSDQFVDNRRNKDLQLERLMPWFEGKESLLDKRCLWVNMSTPLNGLSAEATYPVLEQAWQSWYQWWNPRFPKH